MAKPNFPQCKISRIYKSTITIYLLRKNLGLLNVNLSMPFHLIWILNVTQLDMTGGYKKWSKMIWEAWFK